jgi:hypothetical protein
MAGLSGTGDMQAFVDEYGLEFPTVVSEDGRLWAPFSITLQGAWYFLDEDGEGKIVPYDLYADELSAELDALVNG